MSELLSVTERSALLARAGRTALLQLADTLAAGAYYQELVAPTPGLLMLQVTEPVENQAFYLGEVLITECEVRLGTGVGRGCALGEDPERARALAVIEAAVAGGHPLLCAVGRLLSETAAAVAAEHDREQALLARTRVQFETMEAQDAQHKGSQL